jgi:hypothetical protein
VPGEDANAINFPIIPASPPQPSTIIDLSQLRIEFTVRAAAYQMAKSAEIKIYNLSRSTMESIANTTTRVTLSTGYQNAPTYVIFDGLISWFEFGQETTTETMMQIVAYDADNVFNGSRIVSKTLDQGWEDLDIVNACLQAMQADNVQLGYISPLHRNQAPRSRTLHGPVRDYLSEVADENNGKWYIESGYLYLYVIGDTVQKPAIVLNSSTGLISVPRQTLGRGLNARSLLNGQITPNSVVMINQKDIFQIRAPAYTEGNFQMSAQQYTDLVNTAPVQTDGFYTVNSVTHSGDTRGTPWYTDIETMPINPDQMKPGIAPGVS